MTAILSICWIQFTPHYPIFERVLYKSKLSNYVLSEKYKRQIEMIFGFSLYTVFL